MGREERPAAKSNSSENSTALGEVASLIARVSGALATRPRLPDIASYILGLFELLSDRVRISLRSNIMHGTLPGHSISVYVYMGFVDI